MPDVCYRQNFLTKVLLRADFNTHPLGPLAERPAFSGAVQAAFPHVTSVPLLETVFEFTPAGPGMQQNTMGTQWNHQKRLDGTVVLSLAPTHLTLEYGPGDYTSFDTFRSEFAHAWASLVEHFQVPQADRIGLRYINEIRLPGRALEWDGIVNERLVAATTSGLFQDARLVRSMHQLVQRRGEDQVLLNYGIVNPDYPAPVVQRNYILDVDCFRAGAIDSGSAIQCIGALNRMAEETFEWCIADRLREIMGIIENE